MMDGNHRGVLIGRYNCALDDRNLGVNLDVSLYLRRNDLLDDHRDLNLDGMTDGNLCHRMSDLLVDRKLDDVRHGLTMGDDLMTDVSRVNRNCVLLDQKMVLMKDGNRGHHMSDRLDDRKMVATKDVNHRGVLAGRYNCALDDRNDRNSVVMTDGNLCHRTNGRPDDLMKDVNLDVSLDLRMNDLLGDLNSDDVRRDRKVVLKMDVSLDLRKNDRLDDLMTGVSRVNHKYVRRDLNLVAKMDGMRHHVK
jgi:hypothetical protein